MGYLQLKLSIKNKKTNSKMYFTNLLLEAETIDLENSFDELVVNNGLIRIATWKLNNS